VRSIVASLPFAGLTVLCWGSYGPILHASKGDMGNNSWAQLLCVGIAYFLIAVIIPVAILRTKGEQGQWTKGGFIFGVAAGTFGALGALGIITALTSGGDPIYVMPIVFGGAPVVNTLVSMWIGKLFSKATGGFYLGIILVAVGAAGVLITKPGPVKDSETPAVGQQDVGATDSGEETSVVMVIAGIALTVLCWGSYGTVLHKSQAKMGGSRLRPLFCVGVAYFLIAIIVPLVILSNTGFPDWTFGGAFGSLMAGGCGALGALGIILSFTFGGKPVFVMPLVFGGAPIVNTLIGVADNETAGDGWAWFVASLTLVIVGAITTLVCAPRAGPGKPDEDDGKRDSPQPGDDQAPVAQAAAPGHPAAGDWKAEFQVEQDTAAAEPMEAPGAADGEADKGQSEFAQSVEEPGTVVAGSFDELKSKLEDARTASDQTGVEDDEDDEDELDTVATDPVDDLDPPEDDTGTDEKTDEAEQQGR
jgi:hypothetical protein